jgi:phosphoribosyl-AMP cyclohydrolase
LEEKFLPQLDATKLEAVARLGRGVLPVAAQDVHTGAVLMMAYANDEALRVSLRTRQAVF